MVMKKIMFLLLLSLIVSSCGHVKKKKDDRPSYNSTISFAEAGKNFAATIQLPQDFKTQIPLVILVHEWWGRTPYIEMRSKMLNDLGYATLAVDLFGESVMVDTPAEAQALATPFYQNPQIGIERLAKYVTAAKKDPHVDASKVYVIGYCFGGTQALNFARSGADVAGVVSFHGGLAPGIPAHNVKAHILALNGAADPMVPKKEIKGFEQEMKKNKIDFKSINYAGATHAFSNPRATEIGKKYKIPIAYNAKADKASWEELKKFLAK
jgi:dienelactone hydrolase